MDPVTVTAAAPSIWSQIGGSAFAGAFGMFGGERANASSAKLARQQMDFQERMSSTAHQREVADLKAAGLNPILSASRGGSSTPGGAMAPVQNTAASAMDAARSGQEIRNMKEQWHNINMDTTAKEAQQVLTNRQQAFVEEQTRTQQHHTQRALWEAATAREQFAGHKVEGDIDREGTGDWSRRIQRFLGPINSAVSAGRGAMAGAMGRGINPSRTVWHGRLPRNYPPPTS